MSKLTIEVTAEDIAFGSKKNCYSCPVALVEKEPEAGEDVAVQP